ncbi:MAG: hypothetical protein M3Y50_00420 [Acidobacteriota bacterium]|nr:hypothetical protein [Acidobacteriota bacterium]
MSQHRSIFLHGLSLTLHRFPALLWTYLFNLGLALVFSISLHTQLASILDHSLAAQRLINGFDLGILFNVGGSFRDAPGNPLSGSFGSLALFFLVYFLLVPGTLFCYQTASAARLSTLFQQGLLFFWRFVRITVLALLISGLILGPLSFLQTKWAEHVDNHAVGLHSFLARNAGLVVLFLVASVLRIYFDLVEVYTVQLGLRLRDNGKPDRRVRYALRPAWRTLRSQFGEAWPVFLFLTLLGVAAVLLTARTAMHMLAQPRVWPMFLLAQLGLFLMLLTRFWQRGAETSLALRHPLDSPPQIPIRHVVTATAPPFRIEYPGEQPVSVPSVAPASSLIDDPIPNPEPASPPLDEPDPGIYHHDSIRPPQ